MGFLLFFTRLTVLFSCVFGVGLANADYVIKSNVLIGSFGAEMEVFYGDLSPIVSKLSDFDNENVTSSDEIEVICYVLSNNLQNGFESLEKFMSINQIAQLSMQDYQPQSSKEANQFFWKTLYELQYDVNTTLNVASSVYSFCTDDPYYLYDDQPTEYRTKNVNYGNSQQLLVSLNYLLTRVGHLKIKLDEMKSDENNYVLGVGNAVHTFDFNSEEIENVFSPYIIYTQNP